jgi:F0F1-type ATP synthase membrane subunit b/b'
MFSRSGSPSEGEQPGSDSVETPRSDAARVFDQVMSELQPPGSPPTDPDVASVTAAAEEHASTLRATREAHQEAQKLLALATEARKSASDEAERIVLEAKEAAERARQELAGWAAAQRAKVDALAADMVESANRDADTIRAEALRTSMAEAEETSRAYIADAAERARREGEEIRGEARNVLNHATELGEQVAETITDLTTTVADILERLLAARAAMEQLLSENPPAVSLEEDLDDTDVDVDRQEEAVESGTSDEPGEIAVVLDDDPDATRPDDLDDVAADDLSDDESDDEVAEEGSEEDESAEDESEEGEPDEESVWEAAYDDVDETTTPPSPESGSHRPKDRQLGSMFRRHGHRGD